MKAFSTLFLVATLSLASAELTFDLKPKKASRSLTGMLRSVGGEVKSGADLNGYWGQFKLEGMCVQKINDTEDAYGDKVKFMPCDETCEAQMWQFTKDEPSPHYFYGGMLINMEGGCLAVLGDVTEWKHLKVVECEKNDPQQHWLSNGDNTSPRETKELCMAPRVTPIENLDPVVLLDCDGTYSLDY